MMNFSYFKAIFFLLLVFTVSCVPVEKLSYFNDINEIEDPGVNPRSQKLITSFDKLYIKVLSIDPQTSAIFNSSEEIRYGNASSMVGYFVDEAGNVNLPFVGNVNVGGLTTAKAGDKIQKALNDYVSIPLLLSNMSTTR
jgi:polysaccharide export outer membrane protein